MRRFYYDTTGAANPIVMQGLKKLFGGTSQIVFGTDFPYGMIANTPQALQTVGFTPLELRGIDREGANFSAFRARDLAKIHRAIASW